MTAVASKRYAWKRWWALESRSASDEVSRSPFEGLFGDRSDDAFLPEPNSTLFRGRRAYLRTLSDLRDLRVFVLLGETGSGKTWEVQKEDAQLAEAGIPSLLVDLRTVLETHLADVTLRDPDLLRWLDCPAGATLWLDSLDEAPSDLARVADTLNRELRRLTELQRQRLRLRLVCRSTVWPQMEGLEHALGKVWPGDPVQRFVIQPLTRADVEEAARESEIDPQAFFRSLYERDLATLAARPLGLTLLLEAYSRPDDSLPGNRADLYKSACERLCAEEYRIPRPKSRQSEGMRLAVAKRVAAGSVLSGRALLRVGAGAGEQKSIFPVTLLEGKRVTLSFGGEAGPLTQAELRECLEGSGLFIGAGAPDTFSFAHRSFAEYLAARDLADLGQPLASLQQLLGAPEGHSVIVAPQLQSVAVWLAELRVDVFEWLLETQPALLLGAEGGQVVPELRARLVDRVLDLYRKGELLPWYGAGRQWPRGLCHPGLADQLLPILRDDGEPELVRQVAIRAAEACEQRSLTDELLALSLRATEPARLRYRTVHALGRLGNPQQKQALRPLLDIRPAEDPDEDILGAVLDVLFPDHLTMVELLPYLRPRRRTSYLGSYWWFLKAGVVPRLDRDDLLPALAWLEERAGERVGDLAIEDLEEGILRRAWSEREYAPIMTALARAVLAREERFKHSVRCFAPEGWAPEQDEDRRRLVSLAIRLAHGLPGTTERVVWHLTDYLGRERDVLWALGELEASSAPTEERLWAEVILVSYPSEPSISTQTAVKEKVAESEILKTVMSARLTRDQTATRRARPRAGGEQADDWSAAIRQRLPDVTASTETWAEAWWRLYADTLPGAPSGDVPGGAGLAPELVEPIAMAARAYVEVRDPGVDWIGDASKKTHMVNAGQAALLWLARREGDQLRELGDAAWRRWWLVLFDETLDGEEKLVTDLFATAKEHLGEEVAHEGLDQVLRAGGFRQPLIRRRLLALFWDEWLADHARQEVERAELSEDAEVQLLAALLVRAPGLIEEHVGRRLATHGEEPERALVAACAWLAARPQEAWRFVHQAMKSDVNFGKELVGRLASWQRRWLGQHVLSALLEDQLGELCSWLLHHFPPEKDPKERIGGEAEEQASSGLPPPPQQVAQWRNEALSVLEYRGTFTAVEAIEGLLARHPEKQWLRSARQTALGKYRETVWAWPTPEAVIRMLETPRRRLVRSDAELQRVVLEALSELQSQVRDDPTLVRLFWNHWPDLDRWRPKDENSCSDMLKRELGRLLAPTGALRPLREVVLRQRRGDDAAQRTDLLVLAPAKPDAPEGGELQVAIEVKGCWHRDLKTAMRSQLLERYLLGGDAIHGHGVYLVCWFDLGSWDDDDSRRQDSARAFASPEEALAFFREQAEELSGSSAAQLDAFVLDLSLGRNDGTQAGAATDGTLQPPH